MNPRTLCACQPLAFMISFRVAPPARFSRSRTFSVLLPWRAVDSLFAGLAAFAAVAPFFARAGFLGVLALLSATRARRAPVLAFLAAGGCFSGAVAWAAPFSSVIVVVIFISPA